jgi:predicted DNA-binding transcriptional regulator YafY
MALVRAPRPAARLAELRGAEPTGPPRPDGRVTLRLPVGDRDGMLAWAMGNGVEIIEPAELRTEARQRLLALQAVVGS